MMNPEEITSALARRDETALQAVEQRYGPYIRKIAFDILQSTEDAKEVGNTVLFKLWQEADKAQTMDLKSFLGMLSRQIAIDRLRNISAGRRGSRNYELALNELSEILSDPQSEDPADRLALKNAMSSFLKGLPKRERQLFLCRYWYGMSIGECMKAFGMKESAVKTGLHRMRRKLKEYLNREGIPL